MNRFVIRAIAALATVVALAGCAQIPTDGQVGTITVDSDSAAQTRVDAEGPKPGDGPDAIVRGFIMAGAGYSDNFGVARSFLTDSFAAEWNPTANVNIVAREVSLDSVTTNVSTDSQAVSFDIPVSANIDGRGIFHQKRSDTSVTMEFSLRQVNGEWRISQAPDGLLVSRTNFDNMFNAYPLYFYTPDFSNLVPDVRWLLRTSTTATEIVSQLLDGPAPYLSGAVLSPIPQGTTLSPQAVVIQEGRADVGLSATGLETETKERIFTQVESSLLSLGSVTSVDVSTRDSEVSSGVSVSSTVDVDSQAVAISGGKLVHLVGNTTEPVDGAPDFSKARNPAVSLDGEQFVWLSANGKELSHFNAKDKKTTSIYLGDDLVQPGFDRYGWIWTAEKKGRGLIAVRASGELVSIDFPAVRDRDILGIRVSRDGTRVGVLSYKNGESFVDVIGLIREADNKPARLVNADPIRLAPDFQVVDDITWAGSEAIAFLGHRRGEKGSMPYIQRLTGPVESLGSVSGGVSIAAGNDANTVRIATQSGELFTYSSGSWQRLVDSDVRDPGYPG